MMGRPQGSKNKATKVKEARTGLVRTLIQIVGDTTLADDARLNAAAMLAKLIGGDE